LYIEQVPIEKRLLPGKRILGKELVSLSTGGCEIRDVLRETRSGGKGEGDLENLFTKEKGSSRGHLETWEPLDSPDSDWSEGKPGE